MTATNVAVSPRYDGVDVLRGLAIISVVLMHIWLRLFLNGLPLNPLLPLWILQLFFRNAIDGVPVFFAISGFLITTTCIRRFGSLKRISIPAFYRIRFARIAPLLSIVLAILSVLHLLHVSNFVVGARRGATLPGALFSALTFHLNWYESVHGYLPPAWDVMWSLSVEEMFYLFFPVLCVALLRWRAGHIFFAALLLILIAIGPFARAVWYPGNDIWREDSYFGGADCIALGCLTAIALAWCQREQRRPSEQTLLAMTWLGIGIVALLIYPARMAWRRPLGHSGTWDTLLIAGVCCILFSTVLRNRAGRAWSAPLRWFGRHSYEVYLTHEFIVVPGTALCVRYGNNGRSLILWAIGMFVLSAPLGWVTARYLSEPMNRRLRGTRPPQPAALNLERQP